MRFWFGFFVLMPLPLFAEPIEVDVALVLAVDTSYSMEPDELLLQQRGYAEALTSPMVLNAIASGRLERIAVTYLEWSDDKNLHVAIPWSLIEDSESAGQFAARISAKTFASKQKTSISAALNFAARLFDDSPYWASRRVIDISGDGPNNTGGAVVPSRDAVLGKGITINGLPLVIKREGLNDALPDLDAYYENCVIGGDGSFMLPVFDWKHFPGAIRLKLALEIAGSPPLPAVERIWPAVGYDCEIGEKRLSRSGR